jgi:hypothetical protein
MGCPAKPVKGEAPATRGAPPRIRAGGALVAVALTCAGCMTSKVDETRQTLAAIQPGESIVLLKKPRLEGAGTEGDFLSCVQENLGGDLLHPQDGQSGGKSGKAGAPFRIYGNQEFEDAMFPWFEPSTAPASAGGLKTLLARPGVTERLDQIGVRYVVWLDGDTHVKDGKGSATCSLGGCLGLVWWDKEADYVATVWDLRTATEVGHVTADVTGTSVFIGAIAPIPIVSPVQGKACNRLAEQLRSFLVGADIGAAAAAPSGAGGGH